MSNLLPFAQRVSLLRLAKGFGQISCLALLSMALAAQAQAAPPDLAELARQLAQQQSNADFTWTMTAATLVLMMQGGFLLLEAGQSRSKNSVSVAQKNIADLMLGVVCFYFVGFALMFDGGDWFSGSLGWGARLDDDWSMAFFVFQAVFAATVATIVSGSVAERMAFPAYLICVVVLSAFIYPVFGHWAWGNLLDTQAPAWLADMGFIDFAGSTVVHSMGGWVALAAIICLGPRHGRFDEEGRPLPIHGHSPVLFGAGAVVLFFGWFGFNGGSTTAASPQIAGIILNTILSAAAGGAAAMFIAFAFERQWKVTRSCNGMLAGLVGITAGCAAVSPQGALWIGLICGVLVVASEEFVLRVLKLDDVVGAVSVHGVCGAAGTLLVAAFALPENLVAATRMEQFQVQAYGTGIAAAWGLGLGLVVFGLLRATGLLRVSLEHEIEGLNSAEHGATLGTGLLLQNIHQKVVVERDLTYRFDDKGGDESAEIASLLNPFMDSMQAAVRVLSQQAQIVSEQATSLQALASSSLQNASTVDHCVGHIAERSEQLGRSTREAASTSEVMSEDVAQVASSTSELRRVVAEAEVTVSDLGKAIARAAQTSCDAARASVDADEIAGRANDLMSQLEASTSRISNMIEFIDDVAVKTNMLAINAGVEAARAGTAGQGFGVIASEIRALAVQTKSAADDINSFIAEIIGGVGNVRGSIDDMRAKVARVRSNMASITDEAAQQEERADKSSRDLQAAGLKAQGLETATTKLNQRVEQIARFSHTVAQSAEEAGGQASGLSRLAEAGLGEARDLDGIANDLGEQSARLKQAAGQYRA